MKVYLASSFVSQRRLRPIRDRLFSLGHDVVSSWLDEVAKPEDMPTEVFDQQMALKDLFELCDADCIILDTLEESTTGGRSVEWGYALGQVKLRYHVGPIRSIFDRLADRHFDSWDEAFAYIEANHKAPTYTATGMEGKVFTASVTDPARPPSVKLVEANFKAQHGREEYPNTFGFGHRDW